MSIAAFVLIVALLGGGTTLAAENALPGEALYPVKVGFNEQVRGALALSTEADAYWSVACAQRRLQEAARLAASSEFNANAEAVLNERFSIHVEEVQESIAKLRANNDDAGAAAAAARFESMLRAHADVIVRLQASSLDAQARLIALASQVAAALQSASQTRSELDALLEARIEGDADVTARINNAMSRIERVEMSLDRAEGRMNDEALARVRARLHAANESVSRAQTQLDAGVRTQAFMSANEAARIAEEANVLLEAESELNIEIGAGTETSGETSVPDGLIESSTGANVETGVDIGTDVSGSGDSDLNTEPGTGGEEESSGLIEFDFGY